MADAEAYMALVLANTQGELHPLEEGLHALGSGLSQRAYAEQVGKSANAVQRRSQAAAVARACTDISAELRDRWNQLAELHAAPSWLWPALATELVARGWTVEVTRGKVASLKDAPEPPAWADADAVALEAAAKIKLHGRRAAESIVAIGEELMRTRDAMRDDGTFLAWIAAEFSWKKTQAYCFMQVAEASPNFGSGIANFDVSALYLLARADIDALQAEKQAKVLEAKAQGKSNRQAAKEAGVHHDTVREWTGGGKVQGAEIRQSNPDDPAPLDFAAAAERKRAEAAILRDELAPDDLADFQAEWKAEVARLKAGHAIGAPAAGEGTCTVADLWRLVERGQHFGSIYADPHEHAEAKSACG